MMHGTVLALGMAAETQNLAFWVLAVTSVAAALGMVLSRRAVHCALLLAVVMLSLAFLYAELGAPFLVTPKSYILLARVTSRVACDGPRVPARSPSLPLPSAC